MVSNIDIANLIKAGGVHMDIEGATPPEIYENLSRELDYPDYITPNEFIDSLCQRELILSTAVGNGIAMPHAQSPMAKKTEDQRIAVCYLKRSIDMNAPDGVRVYVMFLLLTSNVQAHLQIISALAKVLHQPEVKKALERKAGLEELVKIISKK